MSGVLRLLASTLAVAVAAVAAVFAGCSGGNDSDPPAARQSNAAYQSLCAALDAARVGDIDVTRDAFDHGPLHELADATIDTDRAAAARLLEAKEAVEADLADHATPPTELADHLQALIETTEVALAATTGAAEPELCEQENP